MYVRILEADRIGRAHGDAGTAIDALVGIDLGMIADGDCIHGARVSARTTSDAGILVNNSSHLNPPSLTAHVGCRK